MDSNRFSKKKGPRIGLNIGASSILVVFVILCLVTFSVLSLVSANADYKLSKKVADRTLAYYDAVCQAEVRLSELGSIQRTAETLEDFYIPISDSQSIHCIAKFPYKGSGSRMEILSFRVDNTENWEQDDTVSNYNSKTE